MLCCAAGHAPAAATTASPSATSATGAILPSPPGVVAVAAAAGVPEVVMKGTMSRYLLYYCATAAVGVVDVDVGC